MTALQVAYLVIVLAMGAVLLQVQGRPPYSCPACGTKKQREHAKDCAWARFYKDE